MVPNCARAGAQRAMRRKEKKMDRILGIFCWVMVAVMAIAVVVFSSASWPAWLLMVLWTIVLAVWTASGHRTVEVGWKGQLLLLGGRKSYFFPEGRRFAPWPLGILPADCRTKPVELDTIKIFTSDGSEVSIKNLSIVWQIFDLDLYHSMDPEKIKVLLDDVVDRNVRTRVRTNTLKEVLGMNLGTENVQTSNDLQEFGIKVVRIVVPEIIPTNPKVIESIELERNERSEQIGQMVEAENFALLMAFLQKSLGEGGAGLTQAQAYEHAQLIVDKSKKSTTAFTLDSSTAAMAAAVLKGIKGP